MWIKSTFYIHCNHLKKYRNCWEILCVQDHLHVHVHVYISRGMLRLCMIWFVQRVWHMNRTWRNPQEAIDPQVGNPWTPCALDLWPPMWKFKYRSRITGSNQERFLIGTSEALETSRWTWSWTVIVINHVMYNNCIILVISKTHFKSIDLPNKSVFGYLHSIERHIFLWNLSTYFKVQF